MEKTEQLDQLLAEYTDSNAWSDYGVIHASDLLRTLGPQGFERLVEQWPLRSSTWQARLADVLGDGKPELAIPTLVEMILRGSDQLAVTAADALRTQLEDNSAPGELPPALAERLKQLHALQKGLSKDSLGSLLTLLEKSWRM